MSRDDRQYVVPVSDQVQREAAVNNLTCIVDEDVQSGFSFQEGFGKAANRLETPQIQLHEHHLITATLLRDEKRSVSPE